MNVDKMTIRVQQALNDAAKLLLEIIINKLK